VYNESVHVTKDIIFERDGATGEVVIVARYKTAVLIENCKAKLSDITLAVGEGSLLHHPLECVCASIEMDDCEMYGGLYAMFAHQQCNIVARQCKFHNAYSMGAHCMDSTASFEDCYFFKNRLPRDLLICTFHARIN
jgi:hypothetical protein